MTVNFLSKSVKFKSISDRKIYFELYGDRSLTRFHFTHKNGNHIDGYFLFTFDKEHKYSLRLWTAVAHTSSLDLNEKSQLKIIGVDEL